MTSHTPLDCLKCHALCCRMAGYVEVSRHDIRRLARHLGLTPREFEEKHVVKVTRSGRKRIKDADQTCQFLAPDRTCTVYDARPTDCRGYVCWDQDDMVVYDYAKFLQLPVAELRELDRNAAKTGS
jgi:Fe-S-cluster containining protein